MAVVARPDLDHEMILLESAGVEIAG